MKFSRVLRHSALMVCGVGLLFQAGCTTVQFFDVLNTVLLGITAAGSFAILQNV